MAGNFTEKMDITQFEALIGGITNISDNTATVNKLNNIDASLGIIADAITESGEHRTIYAQDVVYGNSNVKTELDKLPDIVMSVTKSVTGLEVPTSLREYNYAIDTISGYKPIGVVGCYCTSSYVFVDGFRLNNARDRLFFKAHASSNLNNQTFYVDILYVRE